GVQTCALPIWNFESVVRPRYMVATPQVFGFRSSASGLRVRHSKRGLEHAAGADVGRRDGAELLGRQAPLAIGEQPARLAQPCPVERVADAPRVGKVRLPGALRQVLGERLARAGGEAVVLLRQEPLGDQQ